MDISGGLIWKKILEEIDRRGFFVADVTVLNPNVTYEIGYAIGKQKKLRFVNHADFHDSIERERLGIFDVMGYSSYADSAELANFLNSNILSSKSIFVDDEVDKRAPIYLFDAYEKSELVNHIKTCVKKRLVRFRSFDPQEQARLPVHEAVRDIAISEGVVVSLIPRNYPDSELHNMRAAFVAGLAHGMGKSLSIIQLGDDVTPMDFREFASSCYSKEQVEFAIDKFSLEVSPRIQERVHSAVASDRSVLERIDLGGSVAENELQTIDEYYHETDAYLRTSRGEVKLIIGRKGSGKTALFLRVRNEKRAKRSNVVVDLKPEGYKLLKFKEQIVDALSEGSLNHVVSAIWEYVLLLEIAYKVLEKDSGIFTRNADLTDPYLALKEVYEQDEYYSEGDFSERVSLLLDNIANRIQEERVDESKAILSQRQISEVIYKHPINKLRDAVVEYLQKKDETWLLIDNLDKGWPSAGVSKSDVVLINCLLDALDKIRRSFRQRSYENFFSTVFLRGDVYENLVDAASDRGKVIPVSVDWSDKNALKELLRKRLVFSNFDDNLNILDIWDRIAVPEIDGVSTLDMLIERSLYRPRSIVDMVYACKSMAVNRRHTRIEIDDFNDALKGYSIQLIDNISLELRDIHPELEGLLYEFVDLEPSFNTVKIKKIISKFLKSVDMEFDEDQIVDVLLWFGFIGVQNQNGKPTFIFDVAYNMNMMSALSKKASSGQQFVVHQAFRAGLSISEPIVNPQIRLL
tara:strand:+ start:2137 stop:4377 length:2241 start_codon:yes stop_codon:yes gene_type:complete